VSSAKVARSSRRNGCFVLMLTSLGTRNAVAGERRSRSLELSRKGMHVATYLNQVNLLRATTGNVAWASVEASAHKSKALILHRGQLLSRLMVLLGHGWDLRTRAQGTLGWTTAAPLQGKVSAVGMMGGSIKCSERQQQLKVVCLVHACHVRAHGLWS
jgi:threonine dehydrogenase-like Zn-dependent dehydrogenase